MRTIFLICLLILPFVRGLRGQILHNDTLTLAYVDDSIFIKPVNWIVLNFGPGKEKQSNARGQVIFTDKEMPKWDGLGLVNIKSRDSTVFHYYNWSLLCFSHRKDAMGRIYAADCKIVKGMTLDDFFISNKYHDTLLLKPL